jgi:hypothetical protein
LQVGRRISGESKRRSFVRTTRKTAEDEDRTPNGDKGEIQDLAMMELTVDTPIGGNVKHLGPAVAA